MNTSTTRTAYSSLADFAPDWAIPPGETIAEALMERGWTQVEFAERIGSSIKQVNQLMHGLAPITQETAEKLEVVQRRGGGPGNCREHRADHQRGGA